MSDYSACQKVEAEAIELLLPFANKHNIQITMTQGQQFLQKLYGDFVIRYKGENCKFVELKVEKENKYENLFLESWSNRKWLSPGWIQTCKANLLWYFFLKEKHLISVDFESLKDWLYQEQQIDKYQEKRQCKNEQANDTYGYCVPIKHLREAELKGWREIKIA